MQAVHLQQAVEARQWQWYYKLCGSLTASCSYDTETQERTGNSVDLSV